MNITHIDHLVMTVKDIPQTLHFYESVLGLRAETFLDGRHCLKLGQQKINLHEQGREFEPKAAQPTPGAVDLCLIVEDGLEQAMQRVHDHGVTIEMGPVERHGAQGRMRSFYLRDPDDNLIEIASYSPKG